MPASSRTVARTPYPCHHRCQEGIPTPTTEEIPIIEQRFPPGWDAEQVRQVIAHYETQSEDEQFAEIEEAVESEGVTMMAVPTGLVAEVEALIAARQAD